LIGAVEQLGLSHYWLSLAPSRIGFYPAVDAAIKAFVYARAYSSTRSRTDLNNVLRHYGDALRLLRAAMARQQAPPLEETLASVALLDLLDYLMKGSQHEDSIIPSVWGTSHTGGVAGLLKAAPSTHRVTDLTKGIANFAYGTTSFNPMALGQPSPIEHCAHWWRVVGAAHITMLTDEPSWLTLVPIAGQTINRHIA
jgi:hypothetical protein